MGADQSRAFATSLVYPNWCSFGPSGRKFCSPEIDDRVTWENRLPAGNLEP